MIDTTRIQRALATASLALAFTAAPVALYATSGLTGLTAAAKEAESGGRHEAGDDKGGKRNDDKGGDKHGGKKNDDHPGAHDQNGKGKYK
ncbi:hypothetical protein [Aureimonas leprariae]|uniref:Uncharacterized protein n=1 Tax=Plantimonas leprariae TaxID=2615207 RepID=A0A7V7PPV8_9HYPH|nr:hypothetical protein [Aureimonas leprariae]KAB0680042.1 hypothetical protein F6X38_10770 [Aureimonas leprariae]